MTKKDIMKNKYNRLGNAVEDLLSLKDFNKLAFINELVRLGEFSIIDQVSATTLSRFFGIDKAWFKAIIKRERRCFRNMYPNWKYSYETFNSLRISIDKDNESSYC